MSFLSDDEIYSQLQSTKILTPLNMFVCTLSINIENFNYTMEYITEKFAQEFTLRDSQKKNLVGSKFEIIAMHTNYNHFCRAGCEDELKIKKKKKKNAIKKRQTQGDETVFHSAMQLTIILNMSIDEYLLLGDKTKVKKYYIKLYPSTGKIQIPGIIEPSLRDGDQIIDGILKYINTLHIEYENGILSALVSPLQKIDFLVIKTNIIMINYNTSLNIINSRILFNLNSIGKYIYLLECLCIYENMPELWAIPKYKNTLFSEWDEIILPPFLILNTKLKNNDKFISFLFIQLTDNFILKECKVATVKIFQRGKINVLGVKDQEFAQQIHAFIERVIIYNLRQFIAIKMPPDNI